LQEQMISRQGATKTVFQTISFLLKWNNLCLYDGLANVSVWDKWLTTATV
jgi:hypothetical protein